MRAWVPMWARVRADGMRAHRTPGGLCRPLQEGSHGALKGRLGMDRLHEEEVGLLDRCVRGVDGRRQPQLHGFSVGRRPRVYRIFCQYCHTCRLCTDRRVLVIFALDDIEVTS